MERQRHAIDDMRVGQRRHRVRRLLDEVEIGREIRQIVARHVEAVA